MTDQPSRRLLTIRAEPSGATYLALLNFAQEHSQTFSLVWRKQLAFDASARQIAADLRPFLDNVRETDAWPGTDLVGHTALVRSYRVCAESMRMLSGAERLYAWLAPQRPEDLAFYTADGRWWLCSIAHEHQSFVDTTVVDPAVLVAAVSGLRLS